LAAVELVMREFSRITKSAVLLHVKVIPDRGILRRMRFHLRIWYRVFKRYFKLQEKSAKLIGTRRFHERDLERIFERCHFEIINVFDERKIGFDVCYYLLGKIANSTSDIDI
jgi:hypothetical protein